jgi:purine-binding chemotaxis protein CheW
MNALVESNKGRGKKPEISQVDAEAGQYLTFMLGKEMFAIGILSIKEIIEYGQLTEVPMMPAFVRGVINLRGSVVPVIDLQLRFGRTYTEVGKRTCIVIVEVTDASSGDHHELGVVVDSVSEVIAIPASDIEKAPAFGANLRQDFICGMGKINERFVVLLNVDNALSVNEISELVTLSE